MKHAIMAIGIVFTAFVAGCDGSSPSNLINPSASNEMLVDKVAPNWDGAIQFSEVVVLEPSEGTSENAEHGTVTGTVAFLMAQYQQDGSQVDLSLDLSASLQTDNGTEPVILFSGTSKTLQTILTNGDPTFVVKTYSETSGTGQSGLTLSVRYRLALTGVSIEDVWVSDISKWVSVR